MATHHDDPSSPNATDTTEAPGVRPGSSGIHAPTDKYLKNHNNPLLREYWRVFERKDGTAYIVPRPDGVASMYGICDDPDGESGGLDAIAKAHTGLCDHNNYDADLMNAMDPTDALLLATAFHRQLVFAWPEEPGFKPTTYDDDVVLACTALKSPHSDTLSFCDDTAAGKCTNGSCCNYDCDEQGRCIGMCGTPAKWVMEDLAVAMNEIYGILPGNGACDPLEWGATFGGCPTVAGCPIPPPEKCPLKFMGELNGSRDCCVASCTVKEGGTVSNGCTGITSGALGSLHTNPMQWSFAMAVCLAFTLLRK